MKNLTKLFAGIICAFALVTSTFAADAVKSGTVVQATKAENTSLFNAGEVGLSLSSGYNVDRSAPFQKDYSVNLTAGAFYFPLRNVGFEVNVPFYQSQGVSANEVQFGVLLRVPLSKSTDILRNISPYVGIGGAYNWIAAEDVSYLVKAGVEYRFNSKWGVFGEGQYRHNEFSNFDLGSGQTSLQGGLKFVF